MATIWDRDSWATNGGKTNIIWAHASFISHFRALPLTDAPMTALTENHAILPSSGGMERITGNCLLTKKEDIKS
ncbi:hypothetical protein ACSBR2_005243 [Camellia fascicularis]